MQTTSTAASIRRSVRAIAIAAVAATAAVLIWRVRPAAPTATAAPDADVVLGCAWLAWALAGYLAVAVAATALRHVIPARLGGSDRLNRLAPVRLRRFVDLAITLSLSAALVGTSGIAPAIAMTHGQSTGSHAPGLPASGALDWPGLAAPTPSAVHHPGATHRSSHRPKPGVAPTTRPRPTTRRHHARVGLVGGGPPTSVSTALSQHGDVVVQAGDSLWAIASRHLGPAASAEATAIAWHQWYAANREVVGDDPDLIYPGQRLRVPAGSAASVTSSGSTR
jgi:nucleoid-associated protein YgaU